MSAQQASRLLLTHLNPAYLHHLVAPDMEFDDFISLLQAQTEEVRYQVEGAYLRLHLVDNVRNTPYPLNLAGNIEALQVYLLCTCLDALTVKSSNISVGKRLNSLGMRIK